VDSNSIGILEFYTILDEVHQMGAMDDEETRAHLLKATKRYNYVPPKSEEGYADAMLAEFKRLYGYDQ
jgi:hypothetical protein